MPDQNDARVPDEPQVIACPGCHAQMRRATVSDIQIDQCDRCGGVWLDAREKERLEEVHALKKAEAPDRHTPAPRAKDLHCPRDSALMIHMVDLHQPHVHFESCKVCGGMFFDAGELKDLGRFSIVERIRWTLNKQ